MVNKMSSINNFNQIEWQNRFFDSLDQVTSVEEKIIQTQDLDASLFQTGLRENHEKKVHQVAKDLFESEFTAEELQHVCFAYTGSDGRQEKLSPYSSPTELLLVVKKQENLTSGLVLGVKEKVKELVKRYPTLFYADLEVKCMETDKLMTFTTAKGEERPFPTRALDAYYLVGDANLFQDYRIKFFQELKQNSNSQLLKKFTNNAVKPTLGVLSKTCVGQDTSHVNVQTGVLNYFTSEKMAKKATKYPFLRALQYKLADHICKKVQQGQLKEEEFLQMPVSIVERIQWLADKHLLNMKPQEVQNIQKAYVGALIWFGQAQKNFEVQKQNETVAPASEIQQIAQEINKFCKKAELFA